MSYNGGGGYRRRNRDHDYDRREPVYESPEQKLRASIIRLGEVDGDQELPRLVEQICETTPINISYLSESVRIAVTEQPYKIPYYAALTRLLHDKPSSGEDTTATSLGRQVLEDFWKGFQAYLDKLSWRDTRLCVHFFAHLTTAKVVSPQSMFDLLKSFTAVLDEFGVSHGRAKQAALCAVEGLIMSGAEIKAKTSANVSEITTSIQSYIESIGDNKALVQPTVKLYPTNDPIETADEILEAALAAVQILNSSDFAQTSDIVLQPYTVSPDFADAPFDLPSVLVPPEVIELDALSTDTGEDAQVKKEEWPDYYVRLFDNDVTPDPTTPVGYAIRAGILDLIDIFEINRKECARLLLEFPKWLPHGTFKPRPGAPPQEPVAGKDWQLESTVIETILGTLFLLPDPQHKTIYYIALITELCKLSPSTVGPAVGKSIRKLYGLLADGLDVALASRLIDWFAIHMSNFGFQWVWKEWIPDLDLSLQHPKRVFMRNAIDFEIRLSYYDRILKTLPEPMQNPDNRVVPSEAPGPDYEYDDPARPHYDAAQTVLGLLRGRAKAEDVMSHLESVKNSLETTDSDTNTDSVIRSIAVQSLLHIGSRSFSHFLNAIERYLPLLRNLASGSISTTGVSNLEARMDILTAVSDFWSHSKHMIVIVFDKLMQYQIVDPTDVVSWAFTHGVERIAGSTHPSLSSLQWDVIKSALNKANGRVVIARRKVSALRKEADEKAAMAIVSNGTSMEVDTEVKPDVPEVPEVPEPESPALTTALKAFATLTREQKAALSRTLDGFVDCLASATNPNPTAKTVISENGWHNRANWSEADWVTWGTWGWYRHFCRLYSPYLRNYATTLGTVSFAKVGNAGDPAVDTFRKIWNVTTGQDV
ncbi:MIF4G like-domain-containing protein [Phanerochaete sordida]|uniref:MIF4G like-domain-containing protein n=1 Tax=Phanerochaete sordida TaxID=48140 RepID=A0A9P3L7C9_9APHY|nr:MIF4G like-domain-containing protein [Phanerochaete sordida]